MSTMASLHDARDEHFLDILHMVYKLIDEGADVNVLDKVSYCQAPYYNN